ncbi:hypothetical protein CEXT_194701 [Caerostris extrusa]|uniref:Uncharacterized protein n=1 Tax=Caerostris extrusa TaxID=172846 RepID=A0AAV4XEI3_CAEEX|nr:hypothetical protein CEXT_194701 [Caerostris extrusa]
MDLLGIPDTSFRGLNTLIALNVLKSTSKSWGTMNVIHLEKWEDIYRCFYAKGYQQMQSTQVATASQLLTRETIEPSH